MREPPSSPSFGSLPWAAPPPPLQRPKGAASPPAGAEPPFLRAPCAAAPREKRNSKPKPKPPRDPNTPPSAPPPPWGKVGSGPWLLTFSRERGALRMQACRPRPSGSAVEPPCPPSWSLFLSSARTGSLPARGLMRGPGWCGGHPPGWDLAGASRVLGTVDGSAGVQPKARWAARPGLAGCGRGGRGGAGGAPRGSTGRSGQWGAAAGARSSGRALTAGSPAPSLRQMCPARPLPR